MPFRLPSARRRARSELVAAVAHDGETTRYALVNGSASRERGKLREARSWPAAEAPRWILEDTDAYGANERAEIRAITSVDPAAAEHLLVTVPPDFADASEPQRQAYAIASTPWSNEDTIASVGLTVGMMASAPGSDTYVVGAADTAAVDDAKTRTGLDPARVTVTSMAPALEALFRATHAGDLEHPAPILVVLANDTYVASVVVERGATRAYHTATFHELIAAVVPRRVAHPPRETTPRGATVVDDPTILDADEITPPVAPATARREASSTTNRVSTEPPEGFVAGGGYDPEWFRGSTDRASPPNAATVALDDRDTIEAAFRLALRQALEQYTAIASEAGVEAFATDVDRVYVTGAGVVTYGAFEVAAKYFAGQADVRQVAAHRVTYVYDDHALAAELGDNEPAYADVLALIALARRADLLVLEPFARPAWTDAEARVYGAPSAAGAERSPLFRALTRIVTIAATFALPVILVHHVLLGAEARRLDRDLSAANQRAAELAVELERHRQDAARVADNEANNKVVADADQRNAYEGALLAAVRSVFATLATAGAEARLDTMACDTGTGFSLTGGVADTDTANRLVQALATYGSGAFRDLDLKTDTVQVKEAVPSETDPAKTEERQVDRVRFTIRGHFVR